MEKLDLYDAVSEKEFNAFTQQNVNWHEHLHYGTEIVFVTDGQLAVMKDGTSFLLQKGDALLFMPYEIHSYHTHENSVSSILVFSSEFVEELGVRNRFAKSKFHLPQQLMEYANKIIAQGKWTTTDIRALIYPLFRAFLEGNQIVVAERDYFDVTRRTLLYIEEHYGEDIGLKDAAKFVGCHYAYLSRCFSQNTGYTFTDYLNRYRITRSLYLLRNTENTVIEIAYSCGFGSLRSYNRVFQSCLKETPSEYRASKLQHY